MFEVKTRPGWCYTCLEIDSGLGLESTMEIVERAIDLHSSGDKTVRLKGSNYEGELSNRRMYFTIGATRGNYITGVLESDKGKRNIAFLVREHIDAGLN